MKNVLSSMSCQQNEASAVHVAAVALLDRRDRVLMQRRASEAVHGGLWEFPGGKLEAGESAEAAARREILEELAVTIDIDGLAQVAMVNGFTAGPGASRPLSIFLFACRRWQGEPLAQAASAIGWYELHDLAALAMPPLDYPLAERLVAMLQEKAF
jgi:8-oxo-dGTP diphosphatase